MFSRPVNSGWKPAPSSIRADTRPRTETWPVVGLRMPPRTLSSVDLPEPLEPTMPTIRPRPRSRLTSCSAQSSSPEKSPAPPLPTKRRTKRSLTVDTWRPRYSRKRFETLRSETAMEASGGALTASDFLGEAVAKAVEHPPPPDQRDHRADGTGREGD